MRHTPLTICAALVAVLALAAPAAADDKDFLREVAAPPNLIFILDTSSSMVGSPEVAPLMQPVEECDPNELVDTDGDGTPDATDPRRCSTGLLVPLTNVPGGGDDPYSRMGIAKRVLRDFLEDVGEANIALAGYAQALPAGGQGVPQKHWVYEARAQDRFHMVESNYAYRMGYNDTHSGLLIDAPGTLYPQAMIGYKLYFDPESIPITDRFGPTNAYATGYAESLADGTTAQLPFDLMPVYFGNYLLDDKGTPDPSDDETLFSDGVFPFYDSGSREADGSMITSEWYYGDPGTRAFPNCEPSIIPTAENPDDGCLAEWDETSGVYIYQRKRRVQLNIPATWDGQPNHFLAVDGTGALVGNTEVADTAGNDDYDGVGGADPDYDGSETSDWMLYVASVEETNYRVCEPPQTLPTWTPTPTKTAEEYCSALTVYGMAPEYTYAMSAKINNDTGYTAEIRRTYFVWDHHGEHPSTDYVNYMCFGTGLIGAGSPLTTCSSLATSYKYWDDNTGSSGAGDGRYARPLDVSYPFVTDGDTTPRVGNNYTSEWWGRLTTSVSWDGIYEVCFDLALLGAAPDGGDYLCTDLCTVTTGGSFATPTNTPVITRTPTITPTPFSFASATPTSPSGGGTNTPTRTNTPFIIRTSTPTPTFTATPRPPTPTRTPTRTATPVG
jgi:hypothetical protein